MMANLAPALPFLACGLALPFLRGQARNGLMLAAAALAFGFVYQLEPGMAWSTTFLGLELTPLKVDKLSKVFGYIFALNAFAAFLFALKLDDLRQHLAALFYIGAALGAVFAGDLVTLYVCWEVMAVSSTFLILARGTAKSYGAGLRYVLVHLFGGLLLLAGILLHLHETGSIAMAPFEAQSPAAWLVLLGVLVNAAVFPLSSWLSDAYPESTVTGGVILSVYTTKTAAYMLLRCFPGWEVLIAVGCFMAIYGVIYAVLSNNIRRILAFSIINQMGFKIAGAGIGTAMAINGAIAHSFAGIIYTALLWMSAGAVMSMTHRNKCSQLGGLWKSMPWTMVMAVIGALAISGFPGTSGFTSKTLILTAAADQHLGWVWLILEVASAGAFLHAGLKFPYFVFFGTDRGLRPPEAPKHMLGAMSIMAFLCIFLGVYPDPLYNLLPYAMDPAFTVYKSGKVVGQLQLLIFSVLVFFLLLNLLKRTNTIALEVDWFYRKGGALAYAVVDRTFNGLNAACARNAGRVIGWMTTRMATLPQDVAAFAASPFLTPGEGESRKQAVERLRTAVRTGTIGVGPSFIAIVIALALLLTLAI
jgi:multicomponent Na+:H+ antiporter subunit D